jgi:hypothetical protein
MSTLSLAQREDLLHPDADEVVPRSFLEVASDLPQFLVGLMPAQVADEILGGDGTIGHQRRSSSEKARPPASRA